jgi:HAD superfamily hydrolase (TIGR01457 family)
MTEKSLLEIKCFLLDLDGTVYLGNHLLPGAIEFTTFLKQMGLPFYFLTNNSSRSKKDYLQKLSRLGLAAKHDQILTSGEATAIHLKQQKPEAKIALFGTPSLEAEFQTHGFQLVTQSPDFVVLGFDTTLTYEKLQRLCDLIRAGTPYIATHPDINCPTPDGFIPDIGAIIAFVAASTGRQPDTIVGKPHTTIISAAVKKSGLQKEHLAMVGDRLYTDIAMGQAGITTVLVLSGETKPKDLLNAPIQPDFVFENLAGLFAHYQKSFDPNSKGEISS